MTCSVVLCVLFVKIGPRINASLFLLGCEYGVFSLALVSQSEQRWVLWGLGLVDRAMKVVTSGSNWSKGLAQ